MLLCCILKHSISRIFPLSFSEHILCKLSKYNIKPCSLCLWFQAEPQNWCRQLKLLYLQTNLLTEQKQTHRHRKQTYGCQRGKGGGINQEFGSNISTRLCIKQINNKDLLYSIGNSTQYFVMSCIEKESEKEFTYLFIKLNHFAVHLKLT